MQTGENSIIEAGILYHSNSYVHSALVCSKIQDYDVMVEYNNYFLYSIWTPPLNLAPLKSITNCKDFQVLSMGVVSRFAPRV